MTELERELQATVKMQQEIFKQELTKVSDNHETALIAIVKAYTKQFKEAMQVIDKQSDTIDKQSQLLARYENELGELKISLDQEPLDALEKQLDALHNRLDALEQADSDLVEQLNALLTKL